MAEYHVGCGMCGIYAGRLSKDKKRWIDKSDVTNKAIGAVAQFLLQEDERVLFKKDGKKYEMKVCEVEE